MGNKSTGKIQLQAEARRLEALLSASGNYQHLAVVARAGHLVIESHEDAEPYRIARMTPLGAGEFGLSFHTHGGRWEPMPFSGPMQDILRDMIDSLGPYLARTEFSDGTCGTTH